MTARRAFPWLILMLCRFLSFATANSDLAHRVEEDVEQPVRPIGVDGQEGWNVRASLFMYPPTFAFAKIGGAVRYRFMVTDGDGRRHTFESEAPAGADLEGQPRRLGLAGGDGA